MKYALPVDEKRCEFHGGVYKQARGAKGVKLVHVRCVRKKDHWGEHRWQKHRWSWQGKKLAS